MVYAGDGEDFAEVLRDGLRIWEWDSEEELRAEWDALMLYVRDYEAVSYYITKSWEDDYEIIWDSTDGKRDQDDFTNRMCGFCGEGFDLGDPHYYDEEESECYCSEVCFRKEKERFSEL